MVFSESSYDRHFTRLIYVIHFNFLTRLGSIMTTLEKGNPRGTGSLVTVHWRLVTFKYLVDQFLKLWRISKEISQVCKAEKAAKLWHDIRLKIEGLREKKSHGKLFGLILRFEAYSDVFISCNERESEGTFLFRKFYIFKWLYGVCKIFFEIRFKMPL